MDMNKDTQKWRNSLEIVEEIILKLDKTGKGIEMCSELELENLLTREVKDLSGGELQRFAILIASI